MNDEAIAGWAVIVIVMAGLAAGVVAVVARIVRAIYPAFRLNRLVFVGLSGVLAVIIWRGIPHIAHAFFGGSDH